MAATEDAKIHPETLGPLRRVQEFFRLQTSETEWQIHNNIEQLLFQEHSFFRSIPDGDFIQQSHSPNIYSVASVSQVMF